MKKPKILFFDLETSPNLAYVWGKYEQNVIAYHSEWEILSIAYKYQGDRTVKCLSQRTEGSEKKLVEAIWKLFKEADILVAHNGDAFDIKKAKARFLYHKLPPTKVLSSVDTKKVAKNYFSFNSNSLNDLGQFLSLGKKAETGGFDTWLGCMAGKKASWQLMEKYNKQDVVLLEKVYDRFLPHIQNHPSISLLNGDKKGIGCLNCGSDNIQKRGYRATAASIKRQLHCLDCKGWFLGPVGKKKGKK